MKIILKHILRNIWERKGRSLLIILALTIATTVFTLNLTLPDEIVLKVQETMRTIYGDVDIVMTTEEAFDIQDVELGDEQVECTRLLSLNCMLGEEPALIYAVDLNTAKDMNLLGADVPELQERQLTISKDQAKKHDYKEGDKITVTVVQSPDSVTADSVEEAEYEFTVTAIVDNKGLNAMEMEFPLFIGRIEDIAAIKEYQDTQTDSLFIDVANDDHVRDYAEELGENNKNYQIETISDPESIKEQVSFISYLMIMIFAMATIMIVFVVSSLNKIIIAERMPVIGTFRSIGATKGKMNAILVLENAVYGLIGGVIGALAGYGINSNVAGLFITTNGVSLTQETSKIDVKMFALGVVFSVLLQVVVSVKAIRKANKKGIKDIIFDVQSTRYRVMRHRVVVGIILVAVSLIANAVFKDQNLAFTIISIVLLIAGSAMLIPYLLQLISKGFAFVFRKIRWQTAFVASKNIGYNKMIVSSTRVVVVALSLMIAIVTVSGAITNLYQSFRLMVDDYDLVIQNGSKEEAEYEKLLELDGVTHIEYLHYYWDEVTYNDGNKFNVDPTFVGAKEARKYIKELNYKIKDLKADEVLIDEIYAEKNEFKIGDTLKIKFATLNKELEYKIVGTVNSTYFTTTRNVIIMNYDQYIEQISKIPMQVQLKVEDGTDMEKLKDEVDDTLKELNLKIQTVEEYIVEQEESTASIMSLFYVVIGLAVILSFIGIINNQVIGFMQRRKELAVLNSTCMSKGQIRKMLFFETVLANVIACAAAIAVGYLATDMIESFLKGMSMYVDVAYSLSSALSFSAVIFIILLLTLLSPMKKLKKMNIVNEIKYE